MGSFHPHATHTRPRTTHARQRPPHAQDSTVQAITRYVTDGTVTTPPETSTFRDHLEFGESAPNQFAMTLLPSPTPEQIREIAEVWDLHPTTRDDLLERGQRPKIEYSETTTFLVLRSAWYEDESEAVEFAEFHVLIRRGAVIVLCQDHRWINGTPAALVDEELTDRFRSRYHAFLEDHDFLALGPAAVLYRLLDAIVSGYAPVLHGLAIDKEQIERQVFSGDTAVAERIYRLSQEVIDMQHMTGATLEVMETIREGFTEAGLHEELRAYVEDVADHLAHDHAVVTEYREALSQILNVNSLIVAQRQNEDMKKISGWAAVLFAPSLIGAIYGMNFEIMPELAFPFGYGMAILMMVILAVTLYIVFKARKWM